MVWLVGLAWLIDLGWFGWFGLLVCWLVDLVGRSVDTSTRAYSFRLCDLCHYASRMLERKHCARNYVTSNLFVCRNVPNYVSAVF